jgi:hypothetical protein
MRQYRAPSFGFTATGVMLAPPPARGGGATSPGVERAGMPRYRLAP